eukprot:TRINITY_DN2979_c0_g2_i3.p2 TRINITY_DN2979_c0_g2~~TRINITY_DN2979_c0_g2_i3.p2  ORF type:complete len:104 (+),score=1.85 TRINITY_DN2979_c0_g2_i3:103-414(+)
MMNIKSLFVMMMKTFFWKKKKKKKNIHYCSCGFIMPILFLGSDNSVGAGLMDLVLYITTALISLSICKSTLILFEGYANIKAPSGINAILAPPGAPSLDLITI